MKRLVVTVLLTSILVACASNQPQERATTTERDVDLTTKSQNVAQTGKVESSDTQLVTNSGTQTAAELAMLKSKNSVYFPLDVDTIQPADRETILNHARYLATHPSVKVRVEGHADERGSSEYNLALGQRRAENTKRALVQSGAAATQIETISYGEEKPRALGHDEASWAQNRRADINYDAR